MIIPSLGELSCLSVEVSCLEGLDGLEFISCMGGVCFLGGVGDLEGLGRLSSER
jgi:hypothetical protein